MSKKYYTVGGAVVLLVVGLYVGANLFQGPAGPAGPEGPGGPQGPVGGTRLVDEYASGLIVGQQFVINKNIVMPAGTSTVGYKNTTGRRLFVTLTVFMESASSTYNHVAATSSETAGQGSLSTHFEPNSALTATILMSNQSATSSGPKIVASSSEEFLLEKNEWIRYRMFEAGGSYGTQFPNPGGCDAALELCERATSSNRGSNPVLKIEAHD